MDLRGVDRRREEEGGGGSREGEKSRVVPMPQVTRLLSLFPGEKPPEADCKILSAPECTIPSTNLSTCPGRSRPRPPGAGICELACTL
eukprot:1372064-Pyramimonas_sp.AAC.1